MSRGENKGRIAPLLAVICIALFGAAFVLYRPQEQRDAPTTHPPLRFGAILPISGETGGAGAASEQGLLLAKETISAHPERYAPVRIFVGDSAFDPGQGTAAAHELLAEEFDVDVLFSSFSYVTSGVNAVAKEAEIPLLYDSCNCGFAEENPLAFQIYFDPRKECRAIASYFKQSGINKGAFFGQDVPYGRYCFEAMQEVLGAENVIIETESPDVRRDYPALLSNLKNEGTGFIVSVPGVNDFTELFKANVVSDARLPVACFEGACLSLHVTTHARTGWLEPVIGFGFAISDAFRARATAAGLFAEEYVVAAAVAHDAALYSAAAARECPEHDTACIAQALTTAELTDAAIASTGFGEDRILDYTSAYVRFGAQGRVPFELASP